MAAAVVPSRARAAGDAPPPPNTPDITYVRMNLVVDHLDGDLQPEPKHYFFRWMRGGKQIKVTGAKPASTSPFAQKMALYASVRRHGPLFVSDDPAESLDTKLVLVMTEPNGEPTVVSTVAFDIAYYLNTIVEAGTKTLATTIQMPASITITITLSIKAIGEDHLQRYIPERQPGLTTAESSDMDEVAAALELERLRKEVREKENRLGALEQSTDHLQEAVRRAQPSPNPNDIAVAQTRIKELEEQLVDTDREKSDAERRVSAHMAHAVKIRETYERLAVWYNDLRQEHSELRKKYEDNTKTPSESTDRSIPSDTSAEGGDVLHLREERDKLQAELEQQRSEKSDLHSRNSQLLETKARAMADLRNQWDSAQDTLVTTKKENEEKAQALEVLRNTVESLRSQLLERSATVEEKSSELEEASKRIQEMEGAHSRALDGLQETVEESRSLTASETGTLRRQHSDEMRKLKEEMHAEREADLVSEREKIDLAKASEVDTLREQITLEHESEKSAEIARLTADYERKIQETEEKAQQRVRELESSVTISNEKASASLDESSALGLQLKTLKNDYELQLAAQEKVTNQLREAHTKELQDLTQGKDVADRELVSLRNTTVAETERREEDERLKTNALAEECKQLRAEMESLRKENEEMRSSPRNINSTAQDNQSEQIAEHLNGQIAELKSLLRSESEKRSETAKLLSSADREHDELREMVTRIRSERDAALQDLKHAKDTIPNPEIRHASVQRSLSHERSSDDALGAEEERDKAMRELFRVRKQLNKEVRRLKKENQELAEATPEQSSDGVVADRELSNTVAMLTGERDSAISDLQTARQELEAATSSVSEKREAAIAKTAQAEDLRKRLESAEGELSALRATANDLRESLAESRRESAGHYSQSTTEKETLLKEMNEAKATRTAVEAALRDKEAKLEGLTSELESARRSLGDATRGSEEVSKERDSARNKSAALATELESLKTSLNAMSSSSSSAETMLRDVQREVAEKQAEIKLLRSELEDFKNEIATKEAQRKEDASNFDNSMTQQRSLLDTERLAKDQVFAKTTELEGLVATLNSRNESLSAKLSTERGLKEDAEKRIGDVEKDLERLREELSEVRANELAGAEAVGRASAEREQTNRALSDSTKRVQSIEQGLEQKTFEVMELQRKLGMAEASVDTMKSESNKAAEDGRAIREELHALRAEVTSTQSELKQKSQHLDEEIAKGSAHSEQETAAVRDLTGLSQNLRDENASLQSRLESLQDELRVLKDSNSQIESRLQSAQKDILAKDRSVSDYISLKEAHLQLKEDMERASRETSQASSEKSALLTQVQRLQQDMDALQDQIATIQDENAEVLAAERGSRAGESDELRREVRSARSVVESLQSDLEQAKTENQKLSNEKGENHDSHVLEELINTRLELAYAQEEAVRLRNKLKKVAPKGQGSASFEY